MTGVVSRGNPALLGVTPDASGVNVAVYSSEATAIDMCLFDADGTETQRIGLPFRDENVWHAHIAGVRVGDRYGFRAHGTRDLDAGLRFNPNKLLIDPYALALDRPLRWNAAMGDLDAENADRDSSDAVARCVVTERDFDWADDAPPARPWGETIIYEAHVKGLTKQNLAVEPRLRGTYLGLASAPMIDYLRSLNITAVELLPVQAFIDDEHLVNLGLRNYWGYQPCAWFAPEPRYAIANAVTEFKQMVKALHAAGLEVIVDVVYNHNGEGDVSGPILSLRGLDNRAYYRLDGSGDYVNYTGTGNTLDLTHPATLRLVLDSLRYWVSDMHVDGFRFDLAATLGRVDDGFEARNSFFDALRSDPILRNVKLIAEPWDIGPGGYQLGSFPYPFAEWNDRFRDGVRSVWRGGQVGAAGLGSALLGTAEFFDHGERAATSSINMLTAHDGFTLADVVSYTSKHNDANGEDNHDGHDDNVSDNLGVEGPSTDPAIVAARRRRSAAMLATLFVSQGVPMLLAGDEFGNSQQGNNNAYCQDNDIGWLSWPTADEELTALVRKLTALRLRQPLLRQVHFLHGLQRRVDQLSDVTWHGADFGPIEPNGWDDPDLRTVCVLVRGAAPDVGLADLEAAVYIVCNLGEQVEISLPPDDAWNLVLDSSDVARADEAVEKSVMAAEQSVLVFELR